MDFSTFFTNYKLRQKEATQGSFFLSLAQLPTANIRSCLIFIACIFMSLISYYCFIDNTIAFLYQGIVIGLAVGVLAVLICYGTSPEKNLSKTVKYNPEALDLMEIMNDVFSDNQPFSSINILFIIFAICIGICIILCFIAYLYLQNGTLLLTFIGTTIGIIIILLFRIFVSYSETNLPNIIKEENTLFTLIKFITSIKYLVASFFLCLAIIAVSYFCWHNQTLSLIVIGITIATAIITTIIFCVKSSSANGLVKIEENQKASSKQRMSTLLTVFDDCHLGTVNNQKIDLLISQAEKAQAQSRFSMFDLSGNSFFGKIAIPLILILLTSICTEIARIDLESFIRNTLVIIYLLISLSIISKLVSLAIRDFVLGDYKKYDNLINDLNSLKLFLLVDSSVDNVPTTNTQQIQ